MHNMANKESGSLEWVQIEGLQELRKTIEQSNSKAIGGIRNSGKLPFNPHKNGNLQEIIKQEVDPNFIGEHTPSPKCSVGKIFRKCAN